MKSLSELDAYDRKIINRLFKKRQITPNNCWEYTGALTPQGYSQTRYLDQAELTHRLVYRLLCPEKYNYQLIVCHKCDNKKCFNPDHLYMGTYSENMYDSLARGQRELKTHCLYGHEYTPENTYLIPTGGRDCRKCMAQRTKEWRKRRR
jgi:hypothetical protein